MSMIRSGLAAMALMWVVQAASHAPSIDYMTERDLVVTADLVSSEAEGVLKACLEDTRRCRNDDGTWVYPLQLWLRFLSLEGRPEATALLSAMRSVEDDDHEFELVDARLAAIEGRPEALIELARMNRFRRWPDLALLARLRTPEAASELLARIDAPNPGQLCLAVSMAGPYLRSGDSFHQAFEKRIVARLNESRGSATECLLTALSRDAFEMTGPLHNALADAYLRLLADASSSVRARTLVALQTAWPLLRDARIEEVIVRTALAEATLDPQDRRGALYLASLHRLLPPELTIGASASDAASEAVCCTPSLEVLLEGRNVDHFAWALAMQQTTLAELWARTARFDAVTFESKEAQQWRTHPQYRACRACLMREREVRKLPPATMAELPDATGWSALSRLILIRQGLLTVDEGEQRLLWRESLADDHAWRRPLAVILAAGTCGIYVDPSAGSTLLDATREPSVELSDCLERVVHSTTVGASERSPLPLTP